MDHPQKQNYVLTDEAEETSCITFLHRLCADLSGILGTPIEVHGDEGKVPTTRIQPIGLIVNELAMNAAKHVAGKIDVDYTIFDRVHELSVCDEGQGLPNNFDPVGDSRSWDEGGHDPCKAIRWANDCAS